MKKVSVDTRIVSWSSPRGSHAEIAQDVLDWYTVHARTMPWRVMPDERQSGAEPDPYKIWLSEVMLQQTTVSAVVQYFRAFTKKWPTIKALAAASEDDVLSAWAGLGYYARARNLHKCAKIVAANGGKFPQNSAQLQKLPGIGPYTSAAIAAICYDERIAVLDGNVERVLARLTALNAPVRERKTELRQLLQKMVPQKAGDFAQATMDLGATICAPKRALCDRCPIARYCAAADKGQALQFPVKPQKTVRPQRVGHGFAFIAQNNHILLRQRPEKGLLARMTEMPTSDWQVVDAQNAQALAVEFPITGNWRDQGEIEHVFTHFALKLRIWRLHRENADPELAKLLGAEWVPLTKLRQKALPSLFQKAIKQALIADPAA